MDDIDATIRLAAFNFLDEQVRLAPEGGALPRTVLARGFAYEGQRVPLMGPQGIFKPRVLREIPLSITTVPIVEGETRPYDDAFGEDGRHRSVSPHARGRSRDVANHHRRTGQLAHRERRRRTALAARDHQSGRGRGEEGDRKSAGGGLLKKPK